MKENNKIPLHPGTYVKKHVIPNEVTITKAAELLGIGRPALSNFLNGKSSLSTEMALRLERTFGADLEKLLDLQSHFDRRSEAVHMSIVAGTHSPMLTSIKAAQIEHWANQASARSELPALVRRLIHSTGSKLVFIDLPAYDNAQRHGWDGTVETQSATPWIPNGRSCWEFSCSQRPRFKIEKDYTARVKLVSVEERRLTTIIFVTARNWPQKRIWVSEKRNLDHWKDVRVYDASDLEQWLEHSAATQIWFSERLGKKVSGYRSLDQCWAEWAETCEPVLNPTLFDQFVKESSNDFKQWLTEPPTQPFVIAADSREEGLAFLYCLFDELKSSTDELKVNAVIFDSVEAVQRYKSAEVAPQIAVVHNSEVEKLMGGLYRSCHCIIVRPSNEVNINPDIRLGIVGKKNFQSALKDMNLSEDSIERLERESARSPTILRRTLSKIPAIKKPPWAGRVDIARILLPTTLVGAWDSTNSADREVVQLLADTNEYDDVEIGISELLALEDSPLWSEGQFRGVISRTDSLFGIAKFVTKQDLEDFFFVAELVLSERDPAIDLPEDKKWAAAIYGKIRNYSDALRHGIRESLTVLAVFGEDLFFHKLGVDVESRVSSLINNLFTPFSIERFMSQNSDLPEYAEAAPETILTLIETDLKKIKPVLRELMYPVSSGYLDSPKRTHLLWALECLAWNPSYFPRVVNVLAKLCELEHKEGHDNWLNTSVNTLNSLFRFWWPMTNSSLDDRIVAFETLCHKHPSIGWGLCLSQIDWRRDSVSINYRTRWRNDAVNSHQMANYEERREFLLRVIEIALNWPTYDRDKLIDLVKRLDHFPEDKRLAIWKLIDQWIDSKPSEEEKAQLRQQIQKSIQFYRRGGGRVSNIQRVNVILEKLLSKDPVIQSVWLFESRWIDISTDKSKNRNFDYKENIKRLEKLRKNALRAIWNERGFEGVEDLLDRVNDTAEVIGELIPRILDDGEDVARFAESCLEIATGGDKQQYKACLAGLLRRVESSFINSFVQSSKKINDKILTILLCLPYGKSTWNFLDEKDISLHEAYWKNVEPRLWPFLQSAEEVNQSLDQLLNVGRLDVAFSSAYMMWHKVETSRLVKLLRSLVQNTIEKSSRMIEIDHDVSNAFEELNKRSDISDDEKAELEFAYIAVLNYSEYGVPNLEKRVSESPELFVHVIRCLFKRADGTVEEFSELGFSSPEQHKRVANNWYTFLYRKQRIPGTDAKGEIDVEKLNDWLRQVRYLLQQHNRVDIGDEMIGQMLASASADSDGVWPCREICEALEWMATSHVSIGFNVGKRNLREAEFREVGGNQERELAAQYRRWSRERKYEFPFVGKVLDSIAESYENEAMWWDIETRVRERLLFTR